MSDRHPRSVSIHKTEHAIHTYIYPKLHTNQRKWSSIFNEDDDDDPRVHSILHLINKLMYKILISISNTQTYLNTSKKGKSCNEQNYTQWHVSCSIFISYLRRPPKLHMKKLTFAKVKGLRQRSKTKKWLNEGNKALLALTFAATTKKKKRKKKGPKNHAYSGSTQGIVIKNQLRKKKRKGKSSPSTNL